LTDSGQTSPSPRLDLRSGNEHLVEGTDRMHAMRTSDDRPSDIELGQALFGIRELRNPRRSSILVFRDLHIKREQ